MNRREFLTRSIAAGAVSLTTGALFAQGSVNSLENIDELKDFRIQNGRIKQTTCGWCYHGISTEELAAHGAKIGLSGLDLTTPDEWPILRKYGLICTMTPSHDIKVGLNRIENHEAVCDKIRQSIVVTAEAGYPNVICFSGNREGMDDEEGLENCVVGLKKVIGLAEEKGIILHMELLNSKVNHKDYMCDHTAWGAELARRVGSPNFKLLYDIYHMQVQEGDVIATIREFKDYIGHYHTAGVPGRHELDQTQELYYPAIMEAILETGFQGYVGQEFVPTHDPLLMLNHGVKVCDV